MTDQTRQFSVRPYGDRWGVAIDDEVVLVARTEEEAHAVAATAATAAPAAAAAPAAPTTPAPAGEKK